MAIDGEARALATVKVPIAWVQEFKYLGVRVSPRISYRATDPHLSDGKMYPTLFRMTPDDRVHYTALIKLLQHFGWNWVGILTAWDGSGDEEAQELSKMMSQHGICTEYILKIQDVFKKDNFQNIIINYILDSENCMKCPDEEWPNKKKDRCVTKLVEFLSYTDDTIVVVFSAVSILCCLLTGLILRIFIHYQDTPIVKANNRNLSYLLLVSIMLSFLCVFLFLGHPVDVTCMLRVSSFGVIFSVAVSSLLAKSIMVCIAFKATKPGSPWRKWMGAKLPNFIICVLSLVQVLICVTWLSISPPFQDRDTHSYQGKVIIQCNEGSVIGFYSVLGYMGLLAAVSFIIAFLARTLPDSFNEAKFITFSMLVFCSVWITMIPAYLSTRGKYMVAVEVFALIASSSGLLGCIFFPKCYIILFRPDLNTKTCIH
ncbi:vomeronasal type-2 receptor 26-like [Lithobates pipiens]